RRRRCRDSAQEGAFVRNGWRSPTVAAGLDTSRPALPTTPGKIRQPSLEPESSPRPRKIIAVYRWWLHEAAVSLSSSTRPSRRVLVGAARAGLRCSGAQTLCARFQFL